MKKFFLPTSILCLLTLFFALSSFKAKSNKVAYKNAAVKNVSAEDLTSAEAVSNKLYDSLKLNELGLSKEVLQMAYKGQQQLLNNGVLNNDAVVAIADFSQPSSQKRLYIIDTKNYRVLFNTYVAHGRNSGLTYAERFSNRPESLESSLGFYVTKNTYFGKHGLSLKLEGLEKGFNDNAEARAIVLHGAEYIGTSRADAAYMGRSFGCPAVPQAQSETVINLLKNGTCLFLYHPTEQYLHGSKILNG
ncbi:murein L,D-transpeptidase catalytic domain family protein [Flavisolibacter ginsenosidimutans]|uniref:Murein L,D-transpeptidase catalytic domain family protein n=1 Tax=Flavisolibacter ginsenosidimutans TaxID=661481 RepID=A0A5B8UL87_9BACT|nr:murein L,D-transpeptidase catalytic domain family protein [Flavisolibacter ginsenosidimutans]QEC56949.1 murein L,D-transpeptidase catalytic domain family protein [Flavisolibacter ginsenosidimutans]